MSTEFGFAEFADFDLTSYTETAKDAVVTDDKISIDWETSGSKYSVILRAMKNSKFNLWSGAISGLNQRDTRGEMEGFRYDIVGGGVLLVVKWIQEGTAGRGIYELLPVETSMKSA